MMPVLKYVGFPVAKTHRVVKSYHRLRVVQYTDVMRFLTHYSYMYTFQSVS